MLTANAIGLKIRCMRVGIPRLLPTLGSKLAKQASSKEVSSVGPNPTRATILRAVGGNGDTRGFQMTVLK